jgi:DNA polymerase-3 subunit delta'
LPFRNLAGHAPVVTLLSRAIGRGNLPPTLLFVGPHGVGKFRVAQATAEALNCVSPVTLARQGSLESATAQPSIAGLSAAPTDGLRASPTAGPRATPAEGPRAAATQGLDACGACRACDRISRGVHVDVLRLEPDETGAIKIDAVRDVLDRTAFRPFEGRRRVVIIREADALLGSSQNALLKSLEEPPPGTVFILITSVPGALLPTVRSRCVRLRFGRLSEREVAEVLERDHGIEAAAARESASLSDGSVGRALALESSDVGELRSLALQLLQQGARSAALEPRLRVAATILGASRNERPRDELTLILRLAASMLRDIELLRTGGDAQAMAHRALAGDLTPLVNAYGGDRARDAFAAVDRAMAALERNAGTKVVTEWLASEI